MTSSPKKGIFASMLAYLHRWKVINALYHLARRRDKVVWVEEHDLCISISGQDIYTHKGKDTFCERLRFRFWYCFFRVENHEQLFQKVRNIIQHCETPYIDWIKRTKGDNISDCIALTPRGEDNYAITSLIFGGVSNIRFMILGFFSVSGIWYYGHTMLQWCIDGLRIVGLIE